MVIFFFSFFYPSLSGFHVFFVGVASVCGAFIPFGAILDYECIIVQPVLDPVCCRYCVRCYNTKITTTLWYVWALYTYVFIGVQSTRGRLFVYVPPLKYGEYVFHLFYHIIRTAMYGGHW